MRVNPNNLNTFENGLIRNKDCEKPGLIFALNINYPHFFKHFKGVNSIMKIFHTKMWIIFLIIQSHLVQETKANTISKIIIYYQQFRGLVKIRH